MSGISGHWEVKCIFKVFCFHSATKVFFHLFLFPPWAVSISLSNNLQSTAKVSFSQICYFQHFHFQIHRLESRDNHILSAVLLQTFLNKARLCYRKKTQTTKNLPCSCVRGNVLYYCVIWKRSRVRCCDVLEKDAMQRVSVLTTKLQLYWNRTVCARGLDLNT